MCRILVYAGREARSAADLLGDDDFGRFTALSQLHRDGWGMGWVNGAASPETRKSTAPAYEDPAFAELARQPLGPAGFVHLRWATSGLAVEDANTHPFLADGWAFAHQGSIKPPAALDALLGSRWQALRHGTTDSERYFLLLLQCIDSEGDLVRGVKRATGEIAAACKPASLNAVMLSRSSLVFIHGRHDLEPPRGELRRALGSEERYPPEHLDNYFGIRYREQGDGLTVISSGLGPKGFEEVAANTMLLFDLETHSLSQHPF
jgi:predicted glutamine amidotransferase